MTSPNDDPEMNDAPNADDASSTGESAEEPVGSLASEAARFVGAFTSWAVTHGGDLTQQATDLADHVKAQAQEHFSETPHGDGEEPAAEHAREHAREHAQEHAGADGSPCTACPLCRTLAAVREVSPEVKAHLATAATSLVAAASTLLATVVDPRRGPEASPDASPDDTDA